MRARLFAAQGWVTMIDPDDLSVENVSRTILHSLQREPNIASSPRPLVEGLSTVVEQLLALLVPGGSEAPLVAAAPAALRPLS